MVLAPPAFWFRPERSLAASLLSPLEMVWRSLAERRQRRTVPIDCGLPVLCVGNVSMGGAGKTPVALDLASALQQAGHSVHFLTRGYGGSLKGPVAVDLAKHSAQDVGDEPLLLAKTAPTWVSADRVAGAAAAKAAGASHIVMDDGFQNPTLKKSASVLVLDAGVGVGNGRVFPAGPLRETWQSAVARADLIALLATSWTSGPALPPVDTIPVARAKLVGSLPDSLRPGTRCIAFAGIGRPEKFFETALECGLDVVERKAFPDHHAYSAAEVTALIDRAREQKCALVTTAKDHVRLPSNIAQDVHQIALKLDWKDGNSPFSILSQEDGHVL